MCGIVGFITRPERGPDLAAAMHRPLGALAPRGPDDEGSGLIRWQVSHLARDAWR